ncbi:MAG: DUF3168 domain-containing protein [Aurantimonas endophytica]|uniref:DUF3168 domain-containing protein n=1 Tax=Aurantimonas endophytica TaxID=1522175 RepID=UPI0030025252
MIGPELQKAIFDALKAAPALAGGRVYDRPPPPPSGAFPYITIGDDQVIDDGNSCGDSWEVFSDIHIWSRPQTQSKAEAKTLAAAIVGRLRAVSTVPGHVVTIVAMESARTFRDGDGITEHGIVTMRFVLDEA